MTQETFKKCIGYLQAAFNSISDDFFKLLWNRLKNVDDLEFEKTVSEIIDTFKPTSSEPFPSISRFIEIINLNADKIAVLAVGAVKNAAGRIGPYKSISFGDRAIHATIEHFGGWPEVSNWHDREWGFNERKFIDTYKSYRSTNSGPVKLCGLSEEDFKLNSGNYTPSRLIAAKKIIKAVDYNWYGFNTLIEDKSREKKQLPLIDELVNKLSI